MLGEREKLRIRDATTRVAARASVAAAHGLLSVRWMSKHHGHSHPRQASHSADTTAMAGAQLAADAPTEQSSTPVESTLSEPPPLRSVETFAEDVEKTAESAVDRLFPTLRPWILKNPLLAVGVGFVVGFVAMRITRR